MSILPSDDLLERFQNAIESIKDNLAVQYNQQFKGVGAAKRYAVEKRHPVVTRNSNALDAFIDLRNVLQHSRYRDGRPIATPRLDAVEAIEALASQIENAPTISQFMVKNPVVLGPSTSLAAASEVIITRSLSQIPVCADGAYVGVLTTNALARWLSAAIRRGDGDLIEEGIAVADVLGYAEPHEHARFVKPTFQASRACNVLSADDAPIALLVTPDGQPSAALQGILTRFDVPAVLDALKVRYPG